MGVARPRALPLVAAAALLVAGTGLQACGQPDAGPPATPTPVAAPATMTATTTTATPIAAAPATATPATATPTAAASTTAPTATAVDPAPAATATPAGTRGIQVMPRSTGPEKPPASSGGAREGDPGRVNPDEESRKPPSEPEGASGRVAEPPPDQPSGRVYTWQDGERTRRVILQSDLSVRPTNEVTSQDRVIAFGGASAVVEGGGGQPVFRSESGELMALPGGVLLALDPDWSEEQVGAFLNRNAIPGSRVSDLDWLPNGYFVETPPGLASLHLANALAGQDGVVLAAPNWWREVETR